MNIDVGRAIRLWRQASPELAENPSWPRNLGQLVWIHQNPHLRDNRVSITFPARIPDYWFLRSTDYPGGGGQHTFHWEESGAAIICRKRWTCGPLDTEYYEVWAISPQ